jgi:hypothetical protein
LGAPSNGTFIPRANAVRSARLSRRGGPGRAARPCLKRSPRPGRRERECREPGRIRQVPVHRRRARRGRLLGIAGSAAARARTRLPGPAAVPPALALVALPGIAVLPIAAAAALAAIILPAVGLAAIVSARRLRAAHIARGIGAGGVVRSCLCGSCSAGGGATGAGAGAGSGLASGTKISGLGSSTGVSAGPALRVRGLPRFAGLAPSSPGRIFRRRSWEEGTSGFSVEGGACLGSVQGVHDAVDLGLQESG